MMATTGFPKRVCGSCRLPGHTSPYCNVCDREMYMMSTLRGRNAYEERQHEIRQSGYIPMSKTQYCMAVYGITVEDMRECRINNEELPRKNREACKASTSRNIASFSGTRRQLQRIQRNESGRLIMTSIEVDKGTELQTRLNEYRASAFSDYTAINSIIASYYEKYGMTTHGLIRRGETLELDYLAIDANVSTERRRITEILDELVETMEEEEVTITLELDDDDEEDEDDEDDEEDDDEEDDDDEEETTEQQQQVTSAVTTTTTRHPMLIRTLEDLDDEEDELLLYGTPEQQHIHVMSAPQTPPRPTNRRRQSRQPTQYVETIIETVPPPAPRAITEFVFDEDELDFNYEGDDNFDDTELEAFVNSTFETDVMVPVPIELDGEENAVEHMERRIQQQTETSVNEMTILTETPIEETNCPICLEALTQTNHFVGRCGHQFHAMCIFQCMTRSSNCPCCRQSIIG